MLHLHRSKGHARLTRSALFGLSTLALVLCAPGGGDEIGIDDHRVSDIGGLGNPDYDALFRARVAYDSTDHQYLVVWTADDPDSGPVNGELEVFGQRLDAETGGEVGGFDFLISDMGGIGDANDDAGLAEVVYNSVHNEYLVVWEGTEADFGTVVGEYEIYVQRIDAATGDQVGVNDRRISGVGGIGDPAYGAFWPKVAYDPEHDQYLVTWAGSNNLGGQVALEDEVFIQRLDGATAAEIGVDDQRISSAGGMGDPAFRAIQPAVVYNPTRDEFLVAWSADDPGLFQADDEFEIFVQRIDAVTGAEVGTDDSRVSFVGPNLDPAYDANAPALAYDPIDDRYLVTWYGDDDAPPLVDNENEIFAQLLTGDTAELYGGMQRLSDMGPAGDAAYIAYFPESTWNPVDREFLVVWNGEDGGVLAYNGFEVFLQRMDGNGFERGIDDERLSQMGPDGSALFMAWGAGLAFNPLHNEALVVWSGDDDTPPLVDEEFEIYSQRWIQPLLFADGFESDDTSAWSAVVP